ncbi:hypothetical protein [Obesumbacterium proteus]|uniref:Tail spike TSP1/Gp66 N-terminal domain-containing protein n=1 Tax=Obesumbacterium proteus ATCC 12841 TaxID=1354268 RepID=A0AA91IRB9_9GAMM|nr:hypothetical protein [Obesumbacterium proteus]AMO81127.1 hypothetical protein DSM2777_08780 [Obesumbacterium proteus]OAT60774.1 hypothetical protein M993_00448 [Obesumbacterium proteus ATCC 12841]
MTTTPTNLPVPSESARDLKFNAGKIDEFVTSLALQYIDRFGGKHYTIEGLRKLAFDAISGFGWILVESFEDGATLTLPNQALLWESNGEYYRWAGTLPKTVPAGSTPDSTGGVGPDAWVGIGDAALKTMLATSVGSSMIGMAAGGTLDQVIQYVTPEQFGAIGDGTVHPLSERYSTLAAAQAVYPFVTALTQTIDWAACQKADDDNKGINPIRCPFYAQYHLGNNYLQLNDGSKWYGNTNPANDRVCTTFIREGSVPTFGQDCIVRVINSVDAGSSDEFVRNLSFEGFKLTRKRPRRYASKGDKTIGFHANFAIGLKINVAISGCEYGLLGYGSWNMVGTIIVDSCHKGIWLDPDTATPEHTSPGGSITALDLRVQVDACVFGLVLRHVQYSKITGWVEGMLINPTIYPIYDYTNETAIAVTAYGCDGLDIESLGIEAWQGVMIYGNSSTVTSSIKWNQGALLTNTTGKHGPYYSMSQLMSNAELFTLPATNNSYFYSLNGCLLTLRNMTGDMSSSSFANTFLITVDANARFTMQNTGIYFGSSRIIAPANWVNIIPVGDRFMPDYLVPNGFTYESNGQCISTNWTLKAVNSGDGRVVIDAPAGWKIIDFTVGLVIGTQSQARSYAPIGIVSTNDSQIIFQTGVDTTGFSICYKLRMKVVK